MDERNSNILAQEEPLHRSAVDLRALSRLLAQFSDFDEFRNYLNGPVLAELGYTGAVETETSLSEFSGGQLADAFEMDSLLIPLSRSDAGYVHLKGRADGRKFGTGDLKWLGALSDFFAVVTAQARRHKSALQNSAILEYLINQLPLGVVCFDSEGTIMVQSNLASRQLGENGIKRLSEVVCEARAFNKGRAQLHIDESGRLIYAEGRRLQVEAGLEIVAFVIHDMSGYRKKLATDLELETFRAEATGGRLGVALVEMDGEAGLIYSKLRASLTALGIGESDIQPLGAYSCVCLIKGILPRTFRYLLRRALEGFDGPVKAALLSSDSVATLDYSADSFIERAKDTLEPINIALLPRLLVLDPYPAVAESLGIITQDSFTVDPVYSIEDAVARVSSGFYDGIFVDLDSYAPSEIDELRANLADAGEGFKLYFITHRQPAIAREVSGLENSATFFQKPFRSDEISEHLSLQFDLA